LSLTASITEDVDISGSTIWSAGIGLVNHLKANVPAKLTNPNTAVINIIFLLTGFLLIMGF
jgi:hypothetical protein